MLAKTVPPKQAEKFIHVCVFSSYPRDAVPKTMSPPHESALMIRTGINMTPVKFIIGIHELLVGKAPARINNVTAKLIPIPRIITPVEPDIIVDGEIGTGMDRRPLVNTQTARKKERRIRCLLEKCCMIQYESHFYFSPPIKST